ncbi:MAG: hypothetical protein KTR15_12520 [Phycisphaeraceae bacterium]|nr:hypothetical protein [Phycisphaeraceae bacterium]
MFPEKPKPPLPTRRWLDRVSAAKWLGIDPTQLDRLKLPRSYRLGPQTPRYDIEMLHEEMVKDMNSNESNDNPA